MTPREQAPLHFLGLIYAKPCITLRYLDKRLGVSVGKTHCHPVHALLFKRLITVNGSVGTSQ